MAVADLAAVTAAPRDEWADIQALVKTGFGDLTQASFLLLSVTDAAAARAWLRDLPVTHAGQGRVAEAVQIAVSAPGLRALGIGETVASQFSAEFLSGMQGEESRSRRLGDTGASDPATWEWGALQVPDLLLMLYACDGLPQLKARLLDAGFARGFTARELTTTYMNGVEPFGFADGVSQPAPDWQQARRPGSDADLGYGNLIAPGEFLLGYRNEYGLYTDRPLLPATAPGAAILPTAEDDPARRDLGRNGSYLVLRQLHQDVAGFWRFVADRTETPAQRLALAEAMVGRRLDGQPLIPVTADPIAGVDAADPDDGPKNNFSYRGDPDGHACPFGAHIRRANPRSGDLPDGRVGPVRALLRRLGLLPMGLRDDMIASSRFHRLLRRGREYGTRVGIEAALSAAAPPAGLHFLCLNGNIARQFEFVQNAWLMSGKFNGLSGEDDPLIGNRAALPLGAAPNDAFRLPQPQGPDRCLSGLPQFVTVRGGGYFFLPGLRALRYLAREPD